MSSKINYQSYVKEFIIESCTSSNDHVSINKHVIEF